MSDDYDKQYFSGGTPKNREQWRAQYDRSQEYLDRERAAERRAQEQSQQAQKENLARLERERYSRRHGNEVETTQAPITDKPPTEPLKSVIYKTAMMFMVGAGLWFYFVKQYPLNLELAKVMVAGYIGGAMAGLVLWVFVRVVRFVASIIAALVTFAFWGAVLWFGY